MHSQLMQLPQLQHELKALHEQQQQLEKDRAVQMQVGVHSGGGAVWRAAQQHMCR